MRALACLKPLNEHLVMMHEQCEVFPLLKKGGRAERDRERETERETGGFSTEESTEWFPKLT